MTFDEAEEQLAMVAGETGRRREGDNSGGKAARKLGNLGRKKLTDQIKREKLN